MRSLPTRILHSALIIPAALGLAANERSSSPPRLAAPLHATLLPAVTLRLTPGDKASFPEPLPRNPRKAFSMFPVARVYIKPLNASGKDARVWTLEAEAVEMPFLDDEITSQNVGGGEAANDDPRRKPAPRVSRARVPGALAPRVPMATSVGFVVPQLPRRTYVVWYDAPTPGVPGASMTIEIVPALRAHFGAVVEARSNSDVTVQIGLRGPPTPPLLAPGNAPPSEEPAPLRVSITLENTGNPAVAQLAAGQSAQAATEADGYARWRMHISRKGLSTFIATAPGFDKFAIKVSVDAVPPPTNLVQPGDVLLIVSAMPFVSQAITAGEFLRFGPDPRGHAIYSHAALVVGGDSVAEMLGTGYAVRPLHVSVEDNNYQVDVYRRKGITPDQQRTVAAWGRSYYKLASASTSYANCLGCVSNPHDPDAGGPPPPVDTRYAFEQLVFLEEVTRNPLPGLIQAEAATVDLTAGGRKLFICSELVAWAYYLAGLQLQVTSWPDMTLAGLVNTLERLMDYTTPNMLARSSDLQFIGTLK